MITVDKARFLFHTFPNIDDAIAFADKSHQDTHLGYWANVVKILQLKKTNPNYNL
jgi:hypothetical protein